MVLTRGELLLITRLGKESIERSEYCLRGPFEKYSLPPVFSLPELLLYGPFCRESLYPALKHLESHDLVVTGKNRLSDEHLNVVVPRLKAHKRRLRRKYGKKHPGPILLAQTTQTISRLESRRAHKVIELTPEGMKLAMTLLKYMGTK